MAYIAPPPTVHTPPGPPVAPYRSGLGSTARTLIGLALLLPAVLAWLWSYVVPTISTVWMSFQDNALMDRPKLVGGQNYGRAFDDGLVGRFGFALLLGLLPLALALLVAPLLAVAADRAGRVGRMLTRAVLALPVAGYAPVAAAIGWEFDTHRSLAGRGSVTWMLATTTFGLVIAVAATLYLSALRRGEPGRRRGSALSTVGGLLALGVIAVALQTYTAPTLLGGGGHRQTTTPMSGVFLDAFVTVRSGTAAATSTLLLVALGVLGLGATALLLFSHARIEFDGWRNRPGARPATGGPAAAGAGIVPRRPVAVGVVVLALLVFLGLTGWALSPWLAHGLVGGGRLPSGVDTSRALVNTWMPPFISALVSIALGAVGGFGIGALRPLGRWSELLLVPFAPWLFVGVGPLALALYERTRGEHMINTFTGLIPPTWLSIPALFVFTLLFRGQHARWRAGAGFGSALVLPALPMLAVTFLLTWLVDAEQPLWAYLVANDARTMPAPVLSQEIIARAMEPSGALSLILPLPILLVFALMFAALQLGYADRLAVRVGATPPEHTITRR